MFLQICILVFCVFAAAICLPGCVPRANFAFDFVLFYFIFLFSFFLQICIFVFCIFAAAICLSGCVPLANLWEQASCICQDSCQVGSFPQIETKKTTKGIYCGSLYLEGIVHQSNLMFWIVMGSRSHVVPRVETPGDKIEAHFF